MRTGIATADAPSPSGPRPIKFANVRMEGVEQPLRDAPFFVISFDIPARIKSMKPGDVVCSCRLVPRVALALCSDLQVDS